MFGRQGRSINISEDQLKENSSSAPAAPASSEPTSVEEWIKYQERINEIVYPAILDRTRQHKKSMVDSVNNRQRQLKGNEFPVGSLVMITDPSRKDKNQAKNVGPYKVISITRNNNLILQENHVNGSVLKRQVPPDQASRIETNSNADNENIYEIEAILDHKVINNQLKYLIHWKNYSEVDATWEPPSNFLDTNIVKEYHNSLKKSRKINNNINKAKRQ